MRFLCFEILGSIVQSKVLTMTLIIYWPPELDSAFMCDCSELLFFFMSEFHKILILGDFNTYPCCPSQTLSKEQDNFPQIQGPYWPGDMQQLQRQQSYC